MIKTARVDLYFADGELRLLQFLDDDCARHVAKADREKRRFHLRRQGGGETGLGALIAEDAERVLLLVGRQKKGKALDVVPMKMRDKQSRPDWPIGKLRFQGNAELTQTRARIENNDL